MKTMNGKDITLHADYGFAMPTKEQVEEYIRAVMAKYPKITLPTAYGAFAKKKNRKTEGRK